MSETPAIRRAPSSGLRGSLRRIRAIASKEVMHIFRDMGTLYFAVGMPLIMLILFGYAVSFDVDHIPVVVVDEDGTAESREVVARFFSGQSFTRVGARDRRGPPHDRGRALPPHAGLTASPGEAPGR